MIFVFFVMDVFWKHKSSKTSFQTTLNILLIYNFSQMLLLEL